MQQSRIDYIRGIFVDVTMCVVGFFPGWRLRQGREPGSSAGKISRNWVNQPGILMIELAHLWLIVGLVMVVDWIMGNARVAAFFISFISFIIAAMAIFDGSGAIPRMI